MDGVDYDGIKNFEDTGRKLNFYVLQKLARFYSNDQKASESEKSLDEVLEHIFLSKTRVHNEVFTYSEEELVLVLPSLANAICYFIKTEEYALKKLENIHAKRESRSKALVDLMFLLIYCYDVKKKSNPM